MGGAPASLDNFFYHILYLTLSGKKSLCKSKLMFLFVYNNFATGIALWLIVAFSLLTLLKAYFFYKLISHQN